MILQSRSAFAILAFAAVFSLSSAARCLSADRSPQDLATAAALRDKALSGTRTFEHACSALAMEAATARRCATVLKIRASPPIWAL
jgi:hypothetical protein